MHAATWQVPATIFGFETMLRDLPCSTSGRYRVVQIHNDGKRDGWYVPNVRIWTLLRQPSRTGPEEPPFLVPTYQTARAGCYFTGTGCQQGLWEATSFLGNGPALVWNAWWHRGGTVFPARGHLLSKHNKPNPQVQGGWCRGTRAWFLKKFLKLQRILTTRIVSLNIY